MLILIAVQAATNDTDSEKRENHNKSKFTGDFITYTSGDVIKAESHFTVTRESEI
jgi:hypothetical protein